MGTMTGISIGLIYAHSPMMTGVTLTVIYIDVTLFALEQKRKTVQCYNRNMADFYLKHKRKPGRCYIVFCNTISAEWITVHPLLCLCLD